MSLKIQNTLGNVFENQVSPDVNLLQSEAGTNRFSLRKSSIKFLFDKFYSRFSKNLKFQIRVDMPESDDLVTMTFQFSKVFKIASS